VGIAGLYRLWDCLADRAAGVAVAEGRRCSGILVLQLRIQ